MKRIAIIHTSFVSVSDLAALCAEIIPEVDVTNIVDDSLLPEVRAHNGLTPQVVRRICAYAVEAEQMGVDLILNQCSSVGQAVDTARGMLKTPYLKIDQPMAERAVHLGKNISVIATVPTTLEPSCLLVEEAARSAGKEVRVKRCFVDGAYDALLKYGKQRHNEMVIDRVRAEAAESDAVVLAQGSMICLIPMLADIKAPVLTSPRMGIERVREALGLKPQSERK